MTSLLFLALATLVTLVSSQSIWGLHVQGNRIYNGQNQAIQLRGLDHSGSEYGCVQGWGIFDGPNDNSAIDVMKGWNVNIVRLPLNEDCWLGINGISPSYSGYNYQNAIIDYVSRLNNKGLAVILDLHWSSAGNSQANGQQPMPNMDHSPAFWKSVASVFKNNSAVIFDIFNEPYPDNNQDTTAGWKCWRDGGSCNGINYQVAGMQTLVNTVRSTGSKNILMLGGLQYSNALSQWYSYKPSDPLGQLAASWHSYNFNLCNNQQCWDSILGPLSQNVPVIAGEIGENDCASGYITPLLNWMDKNGLHYLAWTWNTWGCSSGPCLIEDYSGTGTNYGNGYYNHIHPMKDFLMK